MNLKKLFLGIGAVFATAALTLTVTVVVKSQRTYDAPYPAIWASDDADVIARGKYLVTGPAHCIDCHSTDDAPGVMSGGHEWKLPIGIIRSANITSDVETGIGSRTDAELARVLRHGVGPDGKALMPFMPFAEMSDQDLTAVISYLRTLPPVKKQVVRKELNPLGVVMMALLIEPAGPKAEVPVRVAAEATVEYGRYLANNVANCAGCHTARDLRTGAPVGAPFAGGMEMESKHDATVKFVSPNLTPDPETGWITGWSEEDFVARFKSGSALTGATMPWKSYARMSETDLRAIYRYLRTLPPSNNPIRATVTLVSSR